jgi:transposase
VRLMAPQFVKPYVKTNKNDVADAEAICEAVSRPNMRFVPIKTMEQQAILSVHRVSQGFVKARTAQANQIRGLLGEFGLVVPQGIINVTKRIPEILEDASNESPGTAAASSAASSKRSQVSAHWRQLHWSHRSRMRTALTTAGKSPRGLA